jgi:hypothetical protein
MSLIQFPRSRETIGNWPPVAFEPYFLYHLYEYLVSIFHWLVIFFILKFLVWDLPFQLWYFYKRTKIFYKQSRRWFRDWKHLLKNPFIFILFWIKKFQARVLIHIEKRRLIRYYWIKREIWYKRLVRYPSVFILQWLTYSTFDGIWLNEASYFRVSVITEGKNKLIGDYLMGVSCYDFIDYLNEFLLIMFISYHLWFWISLIWKDLYLWNEQHREIFQLAIYSFLIVEPTYREACIYFAQNTTMMGYNMFTNAGLYFFWIVVGVFFSEESDEVYDITLEPRNWALLTWEMQRIWYEHERYSEAYPSDLPWEQRYAAQHSNRLGYNILLCDRKINRLIRLFMKYSKTQDNKFRDLSKYNITVEECKEWLRKTEAAKKSIVKDYELTWEEQVKIREKKDKYPYGKLAINHFFF